MTPDDFINLTFEAANFPTTWQDLALTLQDLNEGRTELRAGSLAENTVNFPIQSIFCQDWDLPIEDHDHWLNLRHDMAEKYPNIQWTPYNEVPLSCVGYPGDVTNPQRPLELDPSLDIVLVGTIHDFATTYEWAQAVDEQAGEAASLVTYEGFGHTIYSLGSECVDKAIDAYFLDGVMPEEGLSCEPRDYFDPEFEQPLASTNDRPY